MKKFQMRASRVRSQQQSADIEFLSNSSTTQALAPNQQAPRGDWELQVSNQLVNTWIRRQAFSKGIIAHGIAVDPRSFSMQDKSFNLHLRLWKLEGWGKWWRDYQVKGTAQLAKKKLQLTGSEVVAKDKSSGAGLADPLALLAEGLILDAIADNLQFGIPIRQTTKIQKANLIARTSDVSGNGDSLSIWGQLESSK